MTLLLIAIGTVLIVFNAVPLVREKSSKKNTLGFSSVLKTSQENMSDVNFAVGELRREFAETILELQQDIYELKEKIDKSDNENQLQEVNIEDKVDEKVIQEAKEEKNSAAVKISEVDRLLQEGLTVDEICERLKLGKGEVLLIKELYLK